MPYRNLSSPIKFTGIVVTYNEETFLDRCLKSLSFCDELIVIDLESSDGSVRIAKEHGAKIYHHLRSPTAESARKEAVEYARNDWIIMMDPDEVLPKGIADAFRLKIFESLDLGVIYLPWQFYFKSKPLTNTIWGSDNKKAFLFHKHRNRFTPDVHYGFSLLDGYRGETLPHIEDYSVKHYWCDSYRQLFEKHLRYIKADGQARYNQGQRFSWLRWVKETINALKVNIFDYKGLNNGFRGLFLTLFYSCYVCLSYLSLYRYQRRVDDRRLV